MFLVCEKEIKGGIFYAVLRKSIVMLKLTTNI